MRLGSLHVPGLGQALLPSDTPLKKVIHLWCKKNGFWHIAKIYCFPSAVDSEICICSRNIDILVYNGKQGFVIWTDSSSRRFYTASGYLSVTSCYWLALGPVLSSFALRNTGCNFNFFAQSMSFSLSRIGTRGTHMHGGDKTQNCQPSCEELSSTCVCITGDTGQFPRPQGTLILTGLCRAVPCDCSGKCCSSPLQLDCLNKFIFYFLFFCSLILPLRSSWWPVLCSQIQHPTISILYNTGTPSNPSCHPSCALEGLYAYTPEQILPLPHLHCSQPFSPLGSWVHFCTFVALLLFPDIRNCSSCCRCVLRSPLKSKVVTWFWK